MALNCFEMFASLKLGINIETTTPPDGVPHVRQPGCVPVYTVRNDAGEILLTGDVARLTEAAHAGLEPLTLYEDDYPVFTAW